MYSKILNIIILSLLPSLIFTKSIFHSQGGQDAYVYNTFFKNKQHPGFFIEIGAYDGISLSNTFFFEKELQWNGICIEPMPHVFEKLKNNRLCTCINGCITNFTGTADFFLASKSSDEPFYGAQKQKIWSNPKDMFSGLVCKMDIRAQEYIGGIKSENIILVPCFTFNDIVKKYNITNINYLSIDTEGGELDILKTINFNDIIIDVITVETNYTDLKKEVLEFMQPQNYTFITRLCQDDLYCRNDFPGLQEIIRAHKIPKENNKKRFSPSKKRPGNFKKRTRK